MNPLLNSRAKTQRSLQTSPSHEEAKVANCRPFFSCVRYRPARLFQSLSCGCCVGFLLVVALKRSRTQLVCQNYISNILLVCRCASKVWKRNRGPTVISARGLCGNHQSVGHTSHPPIRALSNSVFAVRLHLHASRHWSWAIPLASNSNERGHCSVRRQVGDELSRSSSVVPSAVPAPGPCLPPGTLIFARDLCKANPFLSRWFSQLCTFTVWTFALFVFQCCVTFSPPELPPAFL